MYLLFTMPNCGQCLIVKHKLQEKGIKYQEIDVTISKENRELAERYEIKMAGTIIDGDTGELVELE